MSEFILGDCMEHLKDYPDGYFNLAIVDPPYGGVTKGGYMSNNVSGGVARNRNNYHLALWAQIYYGVDMYKCCGVYPKFMTEQTLNGYGYYICLVCGKEGKHEPMQWLAKKSWQDMNKPYEQISIFELLK